VTRTVAIMQPTFLPWIGYFGLMAEVDDFVFLDDVQFSKQSWQSRNRVLGANGPVTLSLPVARKPSKPLIMDARLAYSLSVDNLVKRAAGCLGKAPFWGLAEDLLIHCLARAEDGLAAVNITFISALSARLNITPTFHRSSGLSIASGGKSERLLTICRHLGADRYLSPVGAAGYLSLDNPFSESDVRLRFQTFTPLPYKQGKAEFVSHLSVLDALAWLGPDALAAHIRSGIGTVRTLGELNETK